MSKVTIEIKCNPLHLYVSAVFIKQDKNINSQDNQNQSLICTWSDILKRCEWKRWKVEERERIIS